MKLSEAIEYATNHQKFLDFLRERRISSDSSNSIMAKITNEGKVAIEHRIYIDFGHAGESSNDVRIIVDFDKATEDFKFIQIDHPIRR